MEKKELPVSCSQPVPTSLQDPKVYKVNQVRWSCNQTSTLRPGKGGYGTAALVARGYSGSRGWCQALVPLFGMLLTVQNISHPEVASHLEVKTAICASVALGVAKVVVCDANSHCAADREGQACDSFPRQIGFKTHINYMVSLVP